MSCFLNGLLDMQPIRCLRKSVFETFAPEPRLLPTATAGPAQAVLNDERQTAFHCPPAFEATAGSAGAVPS